MTKEALKLALKRAFHYGVDHWYQADHDSYRENKKADETLEQFLQFVDKTCEALAEQPAQSEQEPVAHLLMKNGKKESFWFDKKDAYDIDLSQGYEWVDLYTTPPQRTWVGLTDEKRMDILLNLNWDNKLSHMDTALTIEAELKELNK